MDNKILKILTKIFFALMIVLSATRADAAGEKILYIPVDDRPITFKQTVAVVEAAGYEMITPPKNYFDRYGNEESPDKLLAWLEETAPSADAAVISTDAILYGGLIPSRKHQFPAEVLNARINRLKILRDKNPKLKIYAVCSLMRAPYEGVEGSVEEPTYYAEHGANIFRYTRLADKESVVGLTGDESTEMNQLREKIPTEYLNDWLSRRQKNLIATENFIDLTASGILNYLIVGLDDHHEFSQTKRESRELIDYAQRKNLSKNEFQALSGTDEFGLVLLTRAIDDLRGEVPKVHVRYNKGVGPLTFPAYSDEVISESIMDELSIMGGKIVSSPEQSDFVLLVNTDPLGQTYHSHNALPDIRDKNFDYNAPRDGTTYFVDMVEHYINEGYPVCVADVTFGNGADNPMMNLLKERGLLFKLRAYAGWNTATNSLGFVIGTGILSQYMTEENKDKILATRYLDDWAYQANVRTTVGDWIYHNIPDARKFYSDFGAKNSAIEARITNLMRDFASKNLPAYDYLRDFNVTCAWNRMFEIDIDFDK